MSQTTRRPISLQGRSSRGLEERIYLRFRWLLMFATRAAWRLPPHSRSRRAVILRVAQIGFDAINRGDFKSSFLLYHPDVEFITPPHFVALGFDRVYRGLKARFDFQRKWTLEWGEMRFEPAEVIDMGDRLLFVGRVKGTGVSSGAEFATEWAVLLTLSAGQLTREQPFFDHREAFEAVGLSE